MYVHIVDSLSFRKTSERTGPPQPRIVSQKGEATRPLARPEVGSALCTAEILESPFALPSIKDKRKKVRYSSQNIYYFN